MHDHNRNLVMASVSSGSSSTFANAVFTKPLDNLTAWYNPTSNIFHYCYHPLIHHSNYAWLVDNRVEEYYDEIILGSVIAEMIHLGYVRIRCEAKPDVFSVEGKTFKCKKAVRVMREAGIKFSKLFLSTENVEIRLMGEDLERYLHKGLLPVGAMIRENIDKVSERPFINLLDNPL